MQRVGIAAFAGQKQRLQAAEIIFCFVDAVGVFAFDGAEGSGRSKQDVDAVLINHPPKRARIRCADRFAFVQYGGAAVKQRRVDNVGMAHNPAYVRSSPVHVAGVYAVDVFHGPFQGHQVAAVVAHDPFGHAGGAGGVEDVKGVGGGDRNTADGFSQGQLLLPVEIAPGDHAGGELRPLQNQAGFWFVLGQIDGFV